MVLVPDHARRPTAGPYDAITPGRRGVDTAGTRTHATDDTIDLVATDQAVTTRGGAVDASGVVRRRGCMKEEQCIEGRPEGRRPTLSYAYDANGADTAPRRPAGTGQSLGVRGRGTAPRQTTERAGSRRQLPQDHIGSAAA